MIKFSDMKVGTVIKLKRTVETHGVLLKVEVKESKAIDTGKVVHTIIFYHFHLPETGKHVIYSDSSLEYYYDCTLHEPEE